MYLSECSKPVKKDFTWDNVLKKMPYNFKDEWYLIYDWIIAIITELLQWS